MEPSDGDAAIVAPDLLALNARNQVAEAALLKPGDVPAAERHPLRRGVVLDALPERDRVIGHAIHQRQWDLVARARSFHFAATTLTNGH